MSMTIPRGGAGHGPFFFATVATPSHALPPEGLFAQSEPGFFVIRNKSGSIYLRLRKRTAYPGTYCERLGNHTYRLGYGYAQSQDDSEFLHITISDSGELSVIRDVHATLPIFYTQDSDTLLMSNEYEGVVLGMKEPTISQAAILELVAMNEHRRPTAQGVRSLKEQERLTLRDGRLSVVRPPDRSWLKSADVAPVSPKDFLQGFSLYLNDFISSRLHGQNFGFEVSGGLDSATLPQYYNHTHGQKATMTSLLFPGSYASSQEQKLQNIAPIVADQVIHVRLDEKAHFPLVRYIKSGEYGHHYRENPYQEAFGPIFERLHAGGIKVICTGNGGDEAFGNTARPEENVHHGHLGRQHRTEAELPAFATPLFRKDYIYHTPDQAAGALPLRAHSVNAVQLTNNQYIRWDIWPVSPFTDPALYEWCQGLPAHFRANKNILRAYHQAHGFVPEIHNPIQNEYFDEFFESCFRSGQYDSTIKELAQDAITAEMGYIDTDGLLEMYRRIREQPYPGSKDDCFSLYLWLSAEINARALEAK